MPHQIYRTKDGTRVPSVTTVISRFKESGGLIHWAWQEGVDGRDYRETRDKAADAGTLAHLLVEQWIKGDTPDIEGPEDVVQKAQAAFGAFLEWAGQTQLKVIHSEVPLISEKHRFGGCLDAMLIKGKLAIGDWKTSNRIYQDHLIQIAAYGELWSENFPAQPIGGGYHIIRFAKDHGDFAHHYFPDLSDAWRAFELMRELYDIDKSLKKRAA